MGGRQGHRRPHLFLDGPPPLLVLLGPGGDLLGRRFVWSRRADSSIIRQEDQERGAGDCGKGVGV